MDRKRKQQKKRTKHKTFKKMERTKIKGERRKNKIKTITYMSTGVFSRSRKGKKQQNLKKAKKEKRGQSEEDRQHR